MEFKKILIGTNTFSPNWLSSIKKINQSNIVIANFENQILVKNIICNNSIDYIIPMSEKDYYLSKNIVSNNTHPQILYPSDENVNLLNNKVLFTKYMIENFYDYIPKVFYLENIKLEENVEYPLISKPIFSTNGKNMFIINNKNKLERCKDKIILQEFIKLKYEYSAHLLCIEGKILNYKIIKQLYPNNHIKKVNFNKYIEITNFPIEPIEKIILNLNYTGGCCVDFKYDEQKNKIYIFELNPRFGGSAFTNNFIYKLLCVKK
jgi:carbamoylphosphate synthase large subunit